MHLVHIALGGCLSSEPARYGMTEDTGGHIAYLLGATEALAARKDIAKIDIVTRAFTGPGQANRFREPVDRLDAKRTILRLSGATDRYLEKAALEADVPHLTQAFLEHLSRSPRPDAIHAHFGDAAQLAIAARDTFGIPFLFSSHSLALQKPARPTARASARVARERRAIDRADAIICSSRDEAERQIAAYAPSAAGRVYRVSPGVTIDAGVDTSAAQALIHPFLTDRHKPILLAIARPVEKKNLRTLVAAYARSRALQGAANLVILAGQREGIGGTGCEGARVTTELFDMIDRADLWGKVALPKRHTGLDVQSLYALAAQGGLFVNPALHEPFGLTIVEAMQHGVPVVATRNGGPLEVVQNAGYGALVDPTNPDEVAGACLRLLTDPQRANRAKAARDHARQAYSWRTWATDVTRVLPGIIGAANTAGRGASQKKPCLSGVARRLLISDLDGTLTGDAAAVAPFKRHLAGGPDLTLVLNTGRAISEARRVLAEWNLPEPEWIISSVGTEVWYRSGAGGYLPMEGYAAQIDQGWQKAELLQAIIGRGVELQAPYEQRRFKISLIGSAPTAQRVRNILQSLGLRARVVASHGRFIDVIPHTAGKAAAAAWLADRLGLDRADCIAAGDSGNDRDLLQWAPMSIVPSNAHPEIRDVSGPSVLRTSKPYVAGVLEGLKQIDAQSFASVAAE